MCWNYQVFLPLLLSRDLFSQTHASPIPAFLAAEECTLFRRACLTFARPCISGRVAQVLWAKYSPVNKNWLSFRGKLAPFPRLQRPCLIRRGGYIGEVGVLLRQGKIKGSNQSKITPILQRDQVWDIMKAQDVSSLSAGKREMRRKETKQKAKYRGTKDTLKTGALHPKAATLLQFALT